LLYSACHFHSRLSVIPVDFPSRYYFNTMLSGLRLASAAMPASACRNQVPHTPARVLWRTA
jgi:hypothetical protein